LAKNETTMPRNAVKKIIRIPHPKAALTEPRGDSLCIFSSVVYVLFE
jgi:hypothetical protein